MRPSHAFLGLAVLAGAFVPPEAARGEEADPHAAFFKAFEAEASKAALEALPAAVRDASPYTAKTEALTPYARDEALYFSLLERIDKGTPATEAARREAVLHFAVATIDWREGDMEKARRRLLLALGRNPFDRLAHLYLARCLGALEDEALKSAGEGSAGEVLHEKVGFGASDLHIELAESVVQKQYPANLEAVTVTFLFDQGKVSDVKTSRAAASANGKLQREKAVAPKRTQLSVVLLAADRTRLDEAWFEPVQTLYMDGMDPSGHPTHSSEKQTTFQVSVELLSPVLATRVLIYDAAGKRLLEAAVPPPAPAK